MFIANRGYITFALSNDMANGFDVIVAGLGANGGAALYNLSLSGKKVLGIDRFAPPHNRGSSHGQSRIIRQAYHENPFYVPYLKEAYRLWDEIEQASGKKLLLKTGGIMLGSAGAGVITGSRRSAEQHDIAYEYLTAQQITKRFPSFKVAPDTVGILEHEAGILFPELCVETFLQHAAANGAAINVNEMVTSIRPGDDIIEVVTDRAVYTTHKLVVSTGAWMTGLLPELALPLKVERQVLYWFKNTAAAMQAALSPDQMPVYIWEYAAGQMFYGFPDLGDGIKIAYHHAGMLIKPDELSQEVSEQEITSMQQITDKYLNMNARFNYSAVCMYTNTPDENFIIDYYPGNSNIIICSPCSGHGFKFSSLTGKLLSDMALEQKTDIVITLFALNRPANH